MADELYGFSEEGFRRVREAVNASRASRRGAQRRRQPPVLSGGTGEISVIGPCASYTPGLSDPDTDYEEAYPGGCDGPDVLGMNLRNAITDVTTVIRMEVASTGPLTLSSDSFTLTCTGGNLTCYAVIVFNSLDVGGVTATIKKVSDNSTVQGYTNAMYSWMPLSAGNLQMGPNAASCDCGTLPYDLCFSVPLR